MTYQTWLEAPYERAERDDAAHEHYLEVCSDHRLVAREIVRRLPSTFELPPFLNVADLEMHLTRYLSWESREWINIAGIALDLWPSYERWWEALNQPDRNRASDE